MGSFTGTLLLVLLGAAASGAAGAQDPSAATMPPPSQHSVLTVQGRGVQLYSCQRSGAAYQWTFAGPAARLFDGDREVGTHGDGPVWHSQDGSSIHGQVVAHAASTEAGAVPWLLLKGIAPEGSGVLSKVQFIRRSETQGGAAPASGCDADHAGEIARVPYTATYTFYTAQ